MSIGAVTADPSASRRPDPTTRGAHVGSTPRCRLPPLRYLAGDDVVAAMPPLDERLALAERHHARARRRARSCRRRSASTHDPMAPSPTRCRRTCAGPRRAAGDLLGMKWVMGWPRTRRAACRGSTAPSCSATPRPACPSAIIDARPDHRGADGAAISASRSARFAPAVSAGRSAARSSAPASRGQPPGGDRTRRSPAPARRVRPRPRPRRGARRARARRRRDRPARPRADRARCGRGADVVVTAASFVAPPERQVMTGDWLGPADARRPGRLRHPTVGRGRARRGAVPRRPPRAVPRNRDAGQFDGYPAPSR